jgi:general nucleoside transport system ATP-binding protein
VLSVTHISKSFHGVPALHDVSLSCAAGEVLALVGENGAGKSTLMNIAYGLYQPTAGEISLNGQKVTLASPAEALKRGVSMVHQHFTSVPTLSALENIALGTDAGPFGWLDFEALRRSVQRVLDSVSLEVDLDRPVGQLTVGSQQKVEIVKALVHGAKVVLFDEPTALLTAQECESFFSLVARLKAQHKAVVLVTHKLDDVFAHASRVQVLRAGRSVADVNATETTPMQVATLMLGEAPSSPILSVPQPVEMPREVLRLENVSAQGVDNVSLSLFSGEVLGIAGVDGNGQLELAEVVAGLRPANAGHLSFEGHTQPLWTVSRARALGVAHVPADRLKYALVNSLTVEENATLGQESLVARGPFIDVAARRTKASALVTANDVRPNNPLARMGDLSGGNQQKLVVAREVATNPRVLVAVQPTRGLDFHASDAVRRTLLEQRARQCAVLLVSLDLEELLRLSDRLLVMYRGRIALELKRSEFDQGSIAAAMAGLAHA